MKREDLKTRLTNAGVPEDKLSEVVDYIMGQNGSDIEGLKNELATLKATHANELETFKNENKELKAKVDGFKDYEDLKKFKTETIEKAENSKKVEFLKTQGCKHPDLIMNKLDFSKGKYDEATNTYTGLDDDVKALKESYGDLFEAVGAQRMTPAQSKQAGNSFLEQYLKENPNMAKFIDQQ